MSHKNTGMSELVFAALTKESPFPPPTDDCPPYHVFLMSIGIMMGRLLERRLFRPEDLLAAAPRVYGKKTVEEVIDLIWGGRRG